MTCGRIELKVQKYLRAIAKNQKRFSKSPLETLADKYAIRVTEHPRDGRVILNYDQIDSQPHKYSPIVRECRGLVLDKNDDYAVVAKSFTRFFNLGESLAESNKFNWNNFSCQEKCDGSLLLVYNWKDQWHVNTRGSFGTGQICDGGPSWEETFHSVVDEIGLGEVPEDLTLVCELCSPWNKVVVEHPKTEVYLLTIVNRNYLVELSSELCDRFARDLRLKRPKVYIFDNVAALIDNVQSFPLVNGKVVFEGVVMKDDANNRIKAKNLDYLRWHRLKNNGNICLPKNLVPFILAGETAELLAAFTELAPLVADLTSRLDAGLASLETLWERANGLASQRDFAIMVREHPLAAVLFTARSSKRSVRDVWRDEKTLNLLLKWLETYRSV